MIQIIDKENFKEILSATRAKLQGAFISPFIQGLEAQESIKIETLVKRSNKLEQYRLMEPIFMQSLDAWIARQIYMSMT